MGALGRDLAGRRWDLERGANEGVGSRYELVPSLQGCGYHLPC